MPPTRDRRWVLAIPAAVLALGVLTAWWIVTPSAFSEVGDASDAAVTGLTGIERGQTYLLGHRERPTASVTLSSVRPLIEGEARTEAYVCDRPVSVEVGSAEEVCGEVTDVAGAQLGPDVERYLVVEVTPTGETGVALRGLAVSYTQGVRFGRQVTGGGVSLDPPGR